MVFSDNLYIYTPAVDGAGPAWYSLDGVTMEASTTPALVSALFSEQLRFLSEPYTETATYDVV